MKTLIIALNLVLHATITPAQLKLSGNIKGLAEDEIVQLNDLEKDQVFCSAKVIGDSFEMLLPKLTSKKYIISLKKAKLGKELWIEDTNIHIEGDLQELIADPLKNSKEFLNTLTISGSSTQLEEDSFYLSIASELRALDTLLHPYEYIYALQPQFSDFESLPRKRDSIENIININKIKYIVSKPSSSFSAFMFLTLLRDNNLNRRDYQDINQAFKSINNSSHYGKIVKSVLTGNYYPLQKGIPFIDIMLKDTNNITRKLSDSVGTLTILNFWETDCPASFPDHGLLMLYHAKYKEIGLAVYSISIDGNPDEWKMHIKKEKLPWINVIDPHGFFSTTAVKYGVNAVPRNILIDKTGKIIDMHFQLDSNESENTIRSLLSK